MAEAYRPEGYLYAAARIRAMEARLLGKEQLGRLSELPTALAVLGASECAEYGAPDAGEGPEDVLERRLAAAYRTVGEIVPDPALCLFPRLVYDCHNAKTLEKCKLRGVPPEGLLIDLGSVSVAKLLAAGEDYPALLPTHLREGVPAAREAFAKTADPQEIEFLLDRAAFADMQAAAAPLDFAAEIMLARTDLANLLAVWRQLGLYTPERMAELLPRAWLAGGSIPAESFEGCEDRKSFLNLVKSTPYAGVFEKSVTAPAECERAADDFVMHLVRRAKYVTYGAEVPIAYLFAVEYEVKNLRILLAAADAAHAREKWRMTYV
jgi:V/A-type H+-transporting ATPase subunit C